MATEREDMARFAADVQAAEQEHQQELDSKDAIMQDCLAAMQAEEQAKVQAQEALRTSRERCGRLEQDWAAAQAELDDLKERCKDLEAQRDETQVCGGDATGVSSKVYTTFVPVSERARHRGSCLSQHRSPLLR